jgi:ParB family transcriptional regulator, chromosome partitioning protein
MSKRDELMKGLANVRESMGDHAVVHGAPGAGPRATPPHLIGVVRSRDVSQIALERIDRDPYQPREDFDPEGLERLAQSLRQRGQLQPIRVRWDGTQERYMIVCGERRWRAAQLAGLESLACVIVEGELLPRERLAIQLVENALREDLRPIEQAKAYRSLMESQDWSARQLAAELSIHHGQVVRALALLGLPQAVQDRVEQGALSPAAAYEVTKLPDPATQAELVERAVVDKLTRQEVIEAVRERKAGVVRGAPSPRQGAQVYRVGEAVTVTVRYRKEQRLTPVQALRIALKQAQAAERAQADNPAHEEKVA